MFRPRLVAALSALFALVLAPAAVAHQGNPNYRSVIDRVSPKVSGLRLQVLNLDDRLELQNTTGKTVTVSGYQGEPYARLLGDGTVEVNRNSPAYYLNNDRTSTGKVPANAKAGAAPSWQVVDRAGRFQWHDHRIHWMSAIPPKQVTDKSKRTKVFDWKVPVQVGSAKGSVDGTLFWAGTAEAGAPVGAIAGLGAIALLGLGAVFVVRRRRAGEGAVVGAAEAEAW
jgi:LPXTG-motif cell wall-anchored protein